MMRRMQAVGKKGNGSTEDTSCPSALGNVVTLVRYLRPLHNVGDLPFMSSSVHGCCVALLQRRDACKLLKHRGKTDYGPMMSRTNNFSTVSNISH